MSHNGTAGVNRGTAVQMKVFLVVRIALREWLQVGHAAPSAQYPTRIRIFPERTERNLVVVYPPGSILSIGRTTKPFSPSPQDLPKSPRPQRLPKPEKMHPFRGIKVGVTQDVVFYLREF